MTAIDIESCKEWIGRSSEDVDIVTPRLLDEYRVTFDPFLADLPELEVPLGFHWCLSPLLAPMHELGPDGHPAKGSFLPPVPLPRRMWAGGTVDYHGELRPGDHVRRRLTIAGIDLKHGRSGPLCFVGVRIDYLTERGLAISDLQNIVYREAPSKEQGAASPATAGEAVVPPDVLEHGWTVTPTPTMLFRYSAVTFNGHRVHYDHPYATGGEGYPGLLVHGPMQATLMLNLAAATRRSVPRRFTCRGLAPLAAGQVFHVRLQPAAQSLRCFTQAEGGPIAMEGEAVW
ncbi:MaoC family dehydratase N-terminal domain-containing protein [Dongia soli]|uniref:MaoC family dehydratase N-terminal domain-containing protein n=1 Tax=Dongia soli TaxID=600628 RepID=A0ABU5EB00_9PROT|nr:MaoC family dehydratase N-terminal domain-containing protein [Dongia soli]MDY0883457.1 MaoC family dehydratase N-terminal domain-containing protein [Dongia soli]